MLRNKDVPQGIVANRLGYPLRLNWERATQTDGSYLLREYSNDQLVKVARNLRRSEKRWKAGKVAAAIIGPVPLLATTGVALFAHQVYANVPVLEATIPFWNAVGSVVGKVFQEDSTIATRLFPTVLSQYAAFLSLAMTELVGPLLGKDVMQNGIDKRRAQSNSVGWEIKLREIAEIKKMQEAQPEPQTSQQPQTA